MSDFIRSKEEQKHERYFELAQDDSDREINEEIRILRDGLRMANEMAVQQYNQYLHEAEHTAPDQAGIFKYLNLDRLSVPRDLLRVAGNAEPARLIINHKIEELTKYTKPFREHKTQRGASLVFKDKGYKPTQDEARLLERYEIELFNRMFKANFVERPSFAKFVQQAYEEFFVLDDITIEYEYDTSGRPDIMKIIDGQFIHHNLKPELIDPNLHSDEAKETALEYLRKILQQSGSINIDSEFVQQNAIPQWENEMRRKFDYLFIIQQGKVLAKYTSDEVRKWHMYQSASMQRAHRGNSIVAQGLRILTYVLNSLTMNASNFTDNRTPRGLLAISGENSRAYMQYIQQVLRAQLQGANNTNRLPIAALPQDGKLNWVGVGGNSRDMEYHQFMTLLFSVWCYLSGTDPQSVGLAKYADAVGKQSLFRDSEDGLLKEMKDSGSELFLKHLQDLINAPFSDGLNIFEKRTGMPIELEFRGFEIEDRKQKLELQTQQLSTTKSINDIRKTNDEPEAMFEIPGIGNLYDIPALSNSSVASFIQQVWQQKQQAEQQQGMEEMPGEEEELEEETEAEEPEGEPEEAEGVNDIEKALRNELTR